MLPPGTMFCELVGIRLFGPQKSRSIGMGDTKVSPGVVTTAANFGNNICCEERIPESVRMDGIPLPEENSQLSASLHLPGPELHKNARIAHSGYSTEKVLHVVEEPNEVPQVLKM